MTATRPLLERAARALTVIWALTLRGLNEITRVPGAAIPGALAPVIFTVGTYSMFGKLSTLPGFTANDYLDFIVPVGLLQAAAFTGAATGVNLARDIEQGWFDRLLLSPTSRGSILSGVVLSASFRTLFPCSVLLASGFALGLTWPGFGGIALAIAMAAGLSASLALWSCYLAMKFQSQDAAPIMQSTGFILVFFSTAYAPAALLDDWLRTVSELNPVTKLLEAVRIGFVDAPAWGSTYPALLSLAGMLAFFGGLALYKIRRVGATA